MHRALGFAALAILTVIPLLILVAAANPDTAPRPGRVGGLRHGPDRFLRRRGDTALLGPARVLGTTSVFSAVLVASPGVVRGQRAGRVRADLGPSRRAVAQDLASGGMGWPASSPTSTRRPRSAR